MKNNSNSMALVYFIIALITIIPLLSIIYAYSIYYNPVLWVSPLITFIFAALIALVVERGVVGFSKLSNGTSIVLYCLIAGIAASLISWLAWLSILSEKGALSVS